MTVSLIIATYNKAQQLKLTLASAATQDFPLDMIQVVITDDGSTDETEQVVCGRSWPFRMDYVRQENMGRSAARNSSIDRACGELLLFIDDDMILPRAFVISHVRCHASRDSETACVSYRRQLYVPRIDGQFCLDTAMDPGLFSSAENLTEFDITNDFPKIVSISKPCIHEPVYRKAFGEDVVEHTAVPWIFFGGCNASVPRALFLHVGGFDAQIAFGEDAEVAYRLYKSGATFIFCPGAVNYHMEHLTPEYHQRKKMNWEISKAYLLAKYEELDMRLYAMFIDGLIDYDSFNTSVRMDCEQVITGKRYGSYFFWEFFNYRNWFNSLKRKGA